MAPTDVIVFMVSSHIVMSRRAKWHEQLAMSFPSAVSSSFQKSLLEPVSSDVLATKFCENNGPRRLERLPEILKRNLVKHICASNKCLHIYGKEPKTLKTLLWTFSYTFIVNKSINKCSPKGRGAFC